MDHKNAEDQFRVKLADRLGISYDELEEYGEDVEANHEEKGSGDYGYFIQFSESTSQEILDKIDRIDRKRTVYFDLEELDGID